MEKIDLHLINRLKFEIDHKKCTLIFVLFQQLDNGKNIIYKLQKVMFLMDAGFCDWLEEIFGNNCDLRIQNGKGEGTVLIFTKASYRGEEPFPDYPLPPNIANGSTAHGSQVDSFLIGICSPPHGYKDLGDFYFSSRIMQ